MIFKSTLDIRYVIPVAVVSVDTSYGVSDTYCRHIVCVSVSDMDTEVYVKCDRASNDILLGRVRRYGSFFFLIKNNYNNNFLFPLTQPFSFQHDTTKIWKNSIDILLERETDAVPLTHPFSF